MQYFYRIWKWENGEKATEYTDYLVAPLFTEPRANEETGTALITLDKLPFSEEFEPKTRIRIEVWGKDENGNWIDCYNHKNKDDTFKYKWDYVVHHDDVESYVGINGVFCHHIELSDPSVVAQAIHCDNFALTYELHDVDLNYRTVINSNDGAGLTKNQIPTNTGTVYFRGPRITNSSVISEGTGVGYGQTGGRIVDTKTFENTETPYRSFFSDTSTLYVRNSFRYVWADYEEISNLKLHLNGLQAHNISFNVPKLKCEWFNGSSWEFLFYIPTTTTVTCETLDIVRVYDNNGNEVNKTYQKSSETQIGSLFFNPINIASSKKEVFYNTNGRVGFYRNNKSSGTLTCRPTAAVSGNSNEIERFTSSSWGKMPAIINTNDRSNNNTEFSFTTPAYAFEDLQTHTYQYVVKTIPTPLENNSLITYINMWDSHSNYRRQSFMGIGGDDQVDYSTDYSVDYPNYECEISTKFSCEDTSVPAIGREFIRKGVPYSCYQLFRKALLTCDTYEIDNDTTSLDEYKSDGTELQSIQFPIVLNKIWNNRLKTTAVNETIFECKNLWEVFTQIGYYLHALPYLRFADDGTDRFELYFKQLGNTQLSPDNGQKITIFNSKNIEEYCAAFDSYVTGLFSPQNECEEWLTVKTGDSSYLISNNTAELHTTHPIIEIIDFEIAHKDNPNNYFDLKPFIFEKSIYDVLSNNNPLQVIPARGAALYFSLGDNKILGLNYAAPNVNVQHKMALKIIVNRLMGNMYHEFANPSFNEFIFHIKYKTQDNARLLQFRPDLERFMKNSSVEKYPHHEQFYGQEDKIIDSERFSAKLWGQLIRKGNSIIQVQEKNDLENMKFPGELIEIRGEPYYITKSENEFYSNSVWQKISYSKNFNQISQIVTIPSEPRFYEISERSKITREIMLNDFFTLSSIEPEAAGNPRFIDTTIWRNFIKRLIFARVDNEQDGYVVLPNTAWTRFKVDKLRDHLNSRGEPVANDLKLFPSSDIVRNGNNSVEPAESTEYVDCLRPILVHPMHDSIQLEWNMADNFKVSDFSDTTTEATGGLDDDAYLSMQALRYCDVFGRADLFQAKLFHKDNYSHQQAQQNPRGSFDPDNDVNSNVIAHMGHGSVAIALEKDNREALSFNYQINLLHKSNEQDLEDFITFPNLFGKKPSRLFVALVNTEVSRFNGILEPYITLADDPNNPHKDLSLPEVSYSLVDTNKGIRLDFDCDNNIDLSEVKAILLYQVENNSTATIIAKNVSKLPDEQKLQPWYIYPVFND